MSLGQRLKACRKTKGKTQVELSRDLEINRSTYAKYETGENEPDNDTLQSIADYFEVTIDYLLTGRKPKVMYQRFNFDTGKIEESFLNSMIADRLVSILDEKDLSFNDLLELANLSDNYMTQITSGNMSFDTLGKVADSLKVSIDYLLGRTNDPTSKPVITKVAGQEMTISPAEFRILEEIKKYPNTFHELTKNPEKKVKDLIVSEKIRKKIEKIMKNDENNCDRDIIEDS